MKWKVFGWKRSLSNFLWLKRKVRGINTNFLNMISSFSLQVGLPPERVISEVFFFNFEIEINVQ